MASIFFPVDHLSTAEEVTGQIETLILEGILDAGSRLPSERDLAQQLNVSRPILRDALKALETRGFLTTGRSGTHVADVIGEVFRQPMISLISSNPKALADYLDYRRELEAVAAAFAAERATDEDRAMLTAIMKRMEDAHLSGAFDVEAACDVEFHTGICECTHNLFLIHTLRACYRLLAAGVFSLRELIYQKADARQALFDQHTAIYDAVMRGDPPAARQAAISHIDFVAKAATKLADHESRARVSRLRLMQRGIVPEQAGSSRQNGDDA